MKKVHISFGDSKYKKSLDILEKSTLEIGGVDEFIPYTKEWLQTTDFWRKNQYILNQKRGAGYWIWKPYIILETFKKLEDGDIVLYSDAGLEVIGNLNSLFEIASDESNGGRMFFKLPAVGVPHHRGRTWTKRDTFVLMDCDSEEYWDADMHNGAISLWEKNERNIELLNEWQRNMRDPRIVTDDPNMAGKPNFMEFKDHRHDQSVLSILIQKYKFKDYRDPTQFGNEVLDDFPECTYGQLFNHHRGRI